jgi:alanyl-tRNA synthetase
MQRDKTMVEALSERLNTPQEKVVEAAERLQLELRETGKKVDSLLTQHNEDVSRSLLERATLVDGVRLVVHQARPGEDAETISKALTMNPSILVIIGVADKNAKVLVSRSPELKVDCRALLKEIMKLLGGGGGGKPEYAQGGGGDASKLPQALALAPELARKALGSH